MTTPPYVITLGTAGGPRWWRHRGSPVRTGIATALVVEGRVYVVDCGYGAGRQLVQAGFGLGDVEAIFLTHLHSDHIVDLTSIALFSTFEITDEREPILLLGPGDRGVLPPTSPHEAPSPHPVGGSSTTPGTAETLRRIVEAHATDLNERILDALRPSPLEVIRARDIELPSTLGFHANDNPVPRMSPLVVHEDSRVRVSAILVEHPPMAPAYGYRFDTDGGSVVISGDTAFTPSMVTLARDTDLLLHEAIDLDWLLAKFPDPKDPGARAVLAHHERSHTSVADALRVANESGARHLALHHLVPGTSGSSLQRQLSATGNLTTSVPDDLDVLPLR